MTDKQTPRRGRGRPKKIVKPDWQAGKAPDPAAPAQKLTKPSWAEKFGDASRWSGEFAPAEEDRLHISKEVLENLEREGVSVQWVAANVLGQPQTHRMNIMKKNGWLEAKPGELPGVEVTEVEGCVLMARPAELHKKSKALEKAEATSRVTNMQASHSGGLPVSGGDHPSARNYNKHNRSIERLDIPKD